MIDIFACTIEPFGSRTMRGHMRDICRLAWINQPGGHLFWFESNGRGPFQIRRRIDAEEKSASDIYILTDDDMLPMSKTIISDGLALMAKYPEFGILSAFPASASIHPWMPEKYEWEAAAQRGMARFPIVNDDVMEHVSVGGLRFCRKGIVQKWPDFTGPGYDKEHCEAIRVAGYRVGYMLNVKANHLGEGFSTTWA